MESPLRNSRPNPGAYGNTHNMSRASKVYADHLYARAKALYKLGFSISEISRRVGIPESFISRRGKQENWQRQAAKIIDIDAKVLEDVAAEEATTNFDKIKNTDAGQRVIEEAKARRVITEVEVWKQNAPVEEVNEHDRLVKLRLRLEDNFMRSAIRNQDLADRQLQAEETAVRAGEKPTLTMKDLHIHADLTKINKATVLGSEPVVQVVTKTEPKDAMATILMPPSMFEAEGSAPTDASSDPIPFSEADGYNSRQED